MSDWGVALLVIVICAVAAMAIAILFRLFGIYHLAACFADDEEKMVLTKHEQGNGYMVNSDTQEYVLDTSGKFVQCDTSVSEPKYTSLDTSTATVTKQQSHDDSTRSSPVSIATSSIASELEYCHGIRRAESCESVASDSSVLEMQPDMPQIGQLELALEYDREVSELVIRIIQARDLAPNQYSGTLDTFIRGVLLADSSDKFQTKTIKNSTDPIYKERFIFNVRSHEIETKIVQFQVYAVDKYARQKVIGESEIRVGDVDLNQQIRMWLNLRDISEEKPTEYGDMMFSLSYLPTAERLTVVIVKARNLNWADKKDYGDPFVKVYLLQNGKKISKKKTTVKRGEKNPIFNEAMIFAVPSSALAEGKNVCIVTVLDENIKRTARKLGKQLFTSYLAFSRHHINVTDADINTSVFGAPSTQSAETPKPKVSAIPVDLIISAVGWSIFQKVYFKDILKFRDFVSQLLVDSVFTKPS